MKEDYNKLAMERVKVMELFHDLQRLQQMDEPLREKFGTDSDLSSFEFGYDGLNEASTINNHNNQFQQIKLAIYQQKHQLMDILRNE